MFIFPLLPEFGPGNDLTMRASIAPLFCLCLLTLDVLLKKIKLKLTCRKLLIVAVLIIGSATPFLELIRPFVIKKIEFTPRVNLYDLSEGKFGHYYAPCLTTTLVDCQKFIGKSKSE